MSRISRVRQAHRGEVGEGSHPLIQMGRQLVARDQFRWIRNRALTPAGRGVAVGLLLLSLIRTWSAQSEIKKGNPQGSRAEVFAPEGEIAAIEGGTVCPDGMVRVPSGGDPSGGGVMLDPSVLGGKLGRSIRSPCRSRVCRPRNCRRQAARKLKGLHQALADRGAIHQTVPGVPITLADRRGLHRLRPPTRPLASLRLSPAAPA